MGRWMLLKPLSVKNFRHVTNGPIRSKAFHWCSARPVDLVSASLRIWEHPDPVPAPFAGAVAAPTSFRACHHSIPLVMDCTICATETSRRDGLSARRAVGGAPGVAAFGRQATRCHQRLGP